MASALELKSPNGDFVASLSNDMDQLTLAITRKGKIVLHESPVGLVIDHNNLAHKAKIDSKELYSLDETYKWYGDQDRRQNKCKGAKLKISSHGQIFELDLRAYDTGIAFKFCYIPVKESLFNGESTVLNLPSKLKAKYMRHSMGEESRVYTANITEIAKSAKHARTLPPLLLYPKDMSSYTVILEGGGFNFHGFSLMPQKSLDHILPLKVEYAEKLEGWKFNTKLETSWKIISQVDTLNTLFNNPIVSNVCPSPDPRLFPNGIEEEWIKPGKSTWNWWAKISAKYEEQIKLVDLAAQIGADYHLVDIGWDQKWIEDGLTPYDHLKNLCDYAAKKDIGIWVWKSSDVSFNMEMPGGEKGMAKWKSLEDVAINKDLDKMRAEVARIAKAGAKGIKLDYIQSENSEWKSYMEDFLKVCAENKLMVNFHGCPSPAGEARTYPNEVTREAIYGGEKLRGGGGAAKMPSSMYVDLIFTRLLAGHSDYTPAIFAKKQGAGFTHAMQLASAMMITSPLLCWADHPNNYLASEGLEIFKSLPTHWDETRVLNDSKLGEQLIMARRKGNDWYIAGINACADKSKQITLNTNFLKNSNYQAYICRDNGKDASIVAEHKAIENNDPLVLNMMASGGFIVRMTKTED